MLKYLIDLYVKTYTYDIFLAFISLDLFYTFRFKSIHFRND